MGLVSSVSLPFAPRLRFTLIPMDAPPYGRAVSDAPPHSGLSPIAVFRHYYSRHLICIVPFTRRGPSHPQASPRFTCIIAYPFVRRDSRTSVADYASLRLCRPTASIRLCTARPPNRMSISLRFSSFQLIVHAELCLAYLHHSYSTIGVPLLGPSRFIRETY